MSNTNEIKVWDLPVRLFHWTLALAVLVTFVTEDDLLWAHTWAGYWVLGLVTVRWVWGFIGSENARFSDFVHPPRETLAYLGDMAAFRARRYLGHNPAGGAMVVAMLLLLPLIALSGMAVYGYLEFSGPLAGLFSASPDSWGAVLKEIHELLANLLLVLVGLHLAGVAIASLQHRENLVRAMWTGFKRKPE
ncbi:MAG: cytochrome b/b6 domain-containing protein [Gammaproteobacteria bacterium]|nr:cytochrome b/b6 domain-containing protein [Gammaproteobacteria bacterium]MBU1654286.1 cytochrome b/b6 domain-containing protein [Gammaproteobacteria bacterium]MBU1960631.1 cytochrome b/b6 domain-containing protein [Gammaproteobacteria bacterium]